MSASEPAVIGFYSTHPISASIVKSKLLAARGSLEGVKPQELYAHDHDHYDGTHANDLLAQAADLKPGMAVADFCAGLAGPARYIAATYGVTVTGIELTPARVSGANELSALVGLNDRVNVVQGDVRNVPLPDSCVDAVFSQEAMLHVPERERALKEAWRILKTGGRFAFTDWIAHDELSRDERDLLWAGMAMQPLETVASYEAKLKAAGFRDITAEDLTAQWGPILAQRLAMYEKLREETRKAGTPEGTDDFYRSYVLFVRLIQEKRMGGARLVATK